MVNKVFRAFSPEFRRSATEPSDSGSNIHVCGWRSDGRETQLWRRTLVQGRVDSLLVRRMPEDRRTVVLAWRRCGTWEACGRCGGWQNWSRYSASFPLSPFCSSVLEPNLYNDIRPRMHSQSVGNPVESWLEVKPKFHLARHVSTRHDSTRSTCQSPCILGCRACRTARLDTLDSTRSTSSTRSTRRARLARHVRHDEHDRRDSHLSLLC